MSTTKVLAIDIGRSTIKSAVVERRGATFTIADVQRTDTISTAGDVPPRLLDLLRRRLRAETGIAAVGIGTTGQVSTQGDVSTTMSDLYRDTTPLGPWLTEELHLPVLVRNDAQLLALGEALYGAGRDWPVVLGLAVGSGVGGGIVRHGKLDIGSDGIAGECGHIRVVDSDERRSCWCGGHGCLEVQVSGPAIEDRYYGITGANAQATEILRSGMVDGPAATVVGAVVQELATGLATLACCVNPDGIVLGGSVGVAIAPLLTTLMETMSHHVYLAVRGTKIRVAQLGVNAQLYGAALLCEAQAAA
jgi:glucokinase